jgi:aldose 1-dehydrogenase [NAD(P)+]
MKEIKVIPGNKGAELVDIDKEYISDSDQILVKTLYTGICGTDTGIVSNALSFAYPPSGKKDMVLGHEALGIVEEVGKNVKNTESGDLVVPMVRRPGNCIQCQAGRQDLCEDGNFVESGIRGKDGFMQEYFLDVEKYLIKVPSNSLKKIAVLTEPLKNIVKVYDTYLNLNTGSIKHCADRSFQCRKALVTGFGPIGILFGLILRTHGFHVSTTNGHTDPIRKSIAEKTGIDLLIDSNHDGSVLEGKCFDLIIDTTRVPSVVINGVKSLNNNGFISLFGTSTGKTSVFDANIITMIVEKNATLFGSVDGSKDHYIRALRYISMWKEMFPDVLESMITSESIPENSIPRLLNKGHDIKHVIKWN